MYVEHLKLTCIGAPCPGVPIKTQRVCLLFDKVGKKFGNFTCFFRRFTVLGLQLLLE